MRVFVALVLLASSSFAESKPNFSGVFLRTGIDTEKHRSPAIPRILEVHQTADEVTATATQNGETAVLRYRLDRKMPDLVRARLTNKNLIVKATVQGPAFPAGSSGLIAAPEKISQTWELSPDSQQLVIRTTSDSGANYSEFFTREPSFEAALAGAASSTQMECNSSVSHWIRDNQPKGNYGEGAFVGLAFFEQITHCVSYDTAIFAKFFKNLAADSKSRPQRFRENGHDLSSYPSDVVLEVQPLRRDCCSPESGLWTTAGNHSPELVQDLRFMVRWMGAEPRDLGEVQSEFIHQPLQELSPPKVFYRMKIPAEGVALTDDLEVLIFSKAGEQLACIKGHI